VITVLLNPAAGLEHNEAVPGRLSELFAKAGSSVRIVPLGVATDAAQTVRSAVETGAAAVVAAGGDGTVRSVAAGLVGSHTPLGVLPLGTLNHFAKDLGIPLDLEQAIEAIVARHQRSVDVGAVNDRVFVNNSSIGIYPDIVAAREDLRRQGHRKWAAFGLATARILRQYRGVRVRLEAGTLKKTAVTPFLFVGNNEYQIEGMRLGSRLRLDAGCLYAYLAPRLRGPDLPKLLALALAGRVVENHALESFATHDLEVKTPSMRAIRVALDGEVTFMTVPLRYRILPRALNVIVPAF
jgi:YegS/Rv2252/BmrU family lipid kinase